MIFTYYKLYKFGQLQQKVRDFGGADRAKKDYNIYRRRTSTILMKERANVGFKLHKLNQLAWKEVTNNRPTPRVVESFQSELHYNHKVDNECMEMDIDGKRVCFDFNYITSTTQKKKPKAQPTAALLRNSNAPRITPQTHGSFVECNFSSTSQVHIIYASKDSDCPLLSIPSFQRIVVP